MAKLEESSLWEDLLGGPKPVVPHELLVLVPCNLQILVRLTSQSFQTVRTHQNLALVLQKSVKPQSYQQSSEHL